MRIPLAYNIRNLAARRVSTILTALGIGLVSWVFIFTLALAGGFQSALQATGSPQNAIVVRNGSTAEVTSIIDRESELRGAERCAQALKQQERTSPEAEARALTAAATSWPRSILPVCFCASETTVNCVWFHRVLPTPESSC